MHLRFVLIVICFAFASAIALAQAQVPAISPSSANIPTNVLSGAQLQGLANALAQNPRNTYVPQDCSGQALRAQLDVTTSVLRMLLDQQSFDQFKANEDTQNPSIQLARRIDIIRQFIQGLKSNASH
jgi:hypothetical protein